MKIEIEHERPCLGARGPDVCPHTSPGIACSTLTGRKRTTLNISGHWPFVNAHDITDIDIAAADDILHLR